MPLLDGLLDHHEEEEVPDFSSHVEASHLHSPTIPNKPVTMRSFDEPHKVRHAIYDKVFEATKNLPKIENSRHTLSLHDVHYDSKDNYTLEEQKKAILEGRTLSRRLRGTLRLTDRASNQPIEEKKTTIAQVPYFSPRGTFIINGSEVTLSHQFRLRPGIYTREKENGELECLHGSMQIWTENGMIPIRDIVNEKMNIRVWSYDFSTNKFLLKAVKDWHRNKLREKLGRTVFNTSARLPGSSHVLVATPSHNVYLSNGEKKELSKSSILLVVNNIETSSSNFRLLGISCEHIGDPDKFFDSVKVAYDIEVEDTHNYFANGVLVSNSHLNVIPGKGLTHRYFLEPETGMFKLQAAQSNMPLMPIMKAMGITDKEIREAWGDELHRINAKKDDPKVVNKLYEKLARDPDSKLSDDDKRKKVKEILEKFEFDPEVTKRTLGHPHKSYDKDVMLKTTKKLLALSRGEAESDDRDHLAYQQFLGPEDLISERMTRAAMALRPLLWKASNKGNLDHIQPNFLTKHVMAGITESGLANCFSADTKVLTKRGFVLWPEVTEEDEFACKVKDKLEYHKADKLIVQDYKGEMICCKNRLLSYLVTPNHRMWCKSKWEGSSFCFKTAEEIFDKDKLHETSLPELINFEDGPFVLPASVNNRWKNEMSAITIDGDLWAEFVGWYVAEGWVFLDDKCWTVNLSQSDIANSVNYKNIKQLLDKLGFHYTYNNINKTFRIRNKQLAEELLKYGKGSGNIRIPRYCFDWSSRRLKILEGAYLAGDGNNHKGYVKAETTSPGLAEDVVELFGRLGSTGRISFRELSEKNENWANSYVISKGIKILTGVDTNASSKRHGSPETHTIEQYDGKIYCASVPGQMLYVMRHGKPVWTGNSIEEINPLEILNNQTKVSRMGVGSIGSLDAIPESSRGVHPSQLGYIDLTSTPESMRAGVDLRMARQALKGDDGKIYAPFIDAKTGKLVHKSPQDITDSIIAFPGELAKARNILAGEKPKAVYAMQSGKLTRVTPDKVDFEMSHMENAFTPTSNLVPFKAQTKAQRVSMGSRFLTQSVALKDPEAPHVQVKMPGEEDRSFEEHYGKDMGAVFNKDQGGKVLKITPNEMLIKQDNGEIKTHELYNSFIFNRKSLLHNTPLVREGERVSPGQLLAKSNFTDDKGRVAIGKNLRTAYISMGGTSYEDAFAISESAAKKLTSESAYQHTIEWDDKHKQGKKNYVSLFPSTFDKKTLNSVDDDGIVKPGTLVKPGDPLVLAASQKDLTHKQVHSGRSGGFSDSSLLWDHHDEGEVVDVSKTEKGVNVVVRAFNKMNIADKLCYDSETEVMTSEGWKYFPDITEEDKLACYVEDKLMFKVPEKLMSYLHVGEMHRFLNQYVDLYVTPDHRLFIIPDEESTDFEFVLAKDVKDGIIHFAVDLNFCTKTNFARFECLTNQRKTFTTHIVNSKFRGKVYCACMPGGLLYVRRNNHYGTWCGNSGKYGDKGTVSKIYKDSEMPHDEQGRPFEVLASPLGLISRVNPSQASEALLGKIAEKRGEPYKVEDFDPKVEDYAQFAKDEADKHGVSSTETITDPSTGKKIPNVFTGVRHYLKLHHVAEAKQSSRGLGSYTADQQPARGPGESAQAKKMAIMDVNALLSHGALEVIKDAKHIRGNQNLEFWSDFMAGNRPASPPEPFVYHKFINFLKASGVNVRREGTRSQIMPMTNKQVDELAGAREITSPETVEWDEGLKPVKGGLFDIGLTGSHSGSRWAKITFHEPMLNPVMEEPTRKLLGLTGKELEDIISGKEKLNNRTGPEAIKFALSSINIDKSIEHARKDIESGRKGQRDDAVKKLFFLKGCQTTKVHPSEWIMNACPVLPPVFRPVSLMKGTGGRLVSDANLLYRDLFEANQSLKELSGKVSDLSHERLNLYNAFKAVSGLGDPVNPKTVEVKARGLLAQVFGSSPKYSIVAQQLVGTPVNNVGRAVVVPNPDLNMDQIELPEQQAWKVYAPTVVRNLVKRGMSRIQSLDAVKNQSESAKKALLEEVDKSPIIMTRAPVLHRYGNLAFWPKLVKGDTIKTNPFIVGPMGMDYDGDNIYDHVFACFSKEFLTNSPLISMIGVDEQFLEDHAVPFAKDLPVITKQGDSVFLIHLEDFPHGNFLRTSEGQFGNIDWYEVPEGVKVLSYNQEEKNWEWRQVSLWSKHHDCKVQIVNLESGRQIFTDDDPRAVYGVKRGTFEFIRCTPKDAIEMGVAVPRLQYLTSSYEVLRTTLDTILTSDRNCRGNHLKKIIDLNEDFGYLVGVIAGDGWSSADKDVCIAGICDEIIAKCDKIIKSLYEDKAPTYCRVESFESYGKSIKYTWTSTELAKIVNELIGKKARNKHFPAWFLNTSENFRLGLLAGIMDTDGSIAVSNGKKKSQLMANITTTSLRMAQEAILLGASLHIRGRITSFDTPGGKPAWVVSWSNFDIQQWNAKFMVHPAKLKALNSVEQIEQNGVLVRYDVVPISTELASVCMASMGPPKDASEDGHSGCYSCLSKAKKRGLIPRDTAKKIVKFFKDCNPLDHPEWSYWWKMIYRDEVTWDMVESFEDTGNTQTGYDLTVPGTETFVSASGVTLSNTSNWHLPISEKAREECIDKMLPSKNLSAVSDLRSPNFLPRQEYTFGLHVLTTKHNKEKAHRTFAKISDLKKSWEKGELDPGDPVHVLDEKS